jgi:hypothetical protein
MGEVVRNLRKQGAKTREINDSVKEALALITKNREIKAKQTADEIAARKAKLQEANPVAPVTVIGDPGPGLEPIKAPVVNCETCKEPCPDASCPDFVPIQHCEACGNEPGPGGLCKNGAMLVCEFCYIPETTVQQSTLATMDESMKNLAEGKAGEPIDTEELRKEIDKADIDENTQITSESSLPI